jgi:tetratricopeptide (TPR) repeat protein
VPIISKRFYSANNPFSTNNHDNRFIELEYENKHVVPLHLQNQYAKALELIRMKRDFHSSLTLLNRLIHEFYERYSEGNRYVWSDAHLLRAFNLMRLNQHSNALKDIEHCVRYDPSNMDVRHLKAKCLVNMGQLDQALAEYNSCLYVQHRNWYARLERARLYRMLAIQAQQVNDKRAKQQYEEYMNHCIHDYSHIIEHSNDVLHHVDINHNDPSVTELDDEKETGTTILDNACIELAWIYTVESNFEKAILLYERLLGQDHLKHSLLVSLSPLPSASSDTAPLNNCLQFSARVQRELKCFEGLSLNYAQLQDHSKAIQYLTLLIEFYKRNNKQQFSNQNYNLYYIKRAISHEALQQYSEAIADVSMYLSTAGNDNNSSTCYSFLIRAKCFIELKQFDKALHDLQRVKALNPSFLKHEIDSMLNLCKLSMQ